MVQISVSAGRNSQPVAAPRAVRMVIAAASASHIMANPHTGTPYSSAKPAAPPA
jgi:hypothetical protein